MYEYSLGSSSTSDLANWVQLNLANGGDGVSSDSSIRDQVMRCMVVGSGTGTTNGKIGFAFVDTADGTASTAKIVGYVEAVIAVTTRRTNLANNGGGYVWSISFPDGSDMLDLTGYGHRVTRPSGTQVNAGPIALYAGLVTVGDAGTVTLHTVPTRAI